MLREHASILKRSSICLDACLVASAFFISYFFVDRVRFLYPLRDYLWFVPLFILTWIGLLYHFESYESMRLKRLSSVIAPVWKSAFGGFFIFGCFFFTTKSIYVSRTLVLFSFLFAATLLVVSKVILVFSLRASRRRGFNWRNILVIGTGERALRFVELVEAHPEWGMRITGFIERDSKHRGQHIVGYPIEGSFMDLPHILHNSVVDEVILNVPKSWLVHVDDLIQLCQVEGVRVSIALDYFQLQHCRIRQSDLDGFPLLSFEGAPEFIWELQIKRLVDMLLSTMALIVVAPLLVVIALLIKIRTPGPVFFTQRRCGLNGREFSMYKFRTMFVDAEARLAELKDTNEMTGPVFKMENDPRVTPLGRFLRRYSLDELPQLWNVMRGDMSLVGPRPPLPTEVSEYENWQRRRLRMRPGLTCLWQVTGRNNITDFDEWARLDLKYIDTWSLLLDWKIMLRTVPVVFTGTGAK